MLNKKLISIALIGGVFYALGFPSLFGKTLLVTPIIGIFCLIYTFSQLESLKLKLISLTLFNFTYNTVGFYWITSTLQEFGELPFLVAFLLSLLFTFVITPQLYIFLCIEHFSLKKRETLSLANNVLVMSLAYTLCEFFIPQQFPVMLGHPWVVLGEYLGFANIAGIPIYTFISALFIYQVINYIKSKTINFYQIGTIILFIILNPLINMTEKVGETKNLELRLVQANISSFLKVDAESGSFASVGQVISRYKSLSLKESEKKLDLIIWPETAYPYSIERDQNEIAKTEIPTIFKDIAFKHGSNLFIGGYDHRYDRDDYYHSEYNTNFFINPNGLLENVYHKHILIPFGETLPLPDSINEKLASSLRNISFFARGDEFAVFKLSSGLRFINTICYEVLKPSFVRDYLNSIDERPHALINLTNDSWYGNTSEPEQHLFLTLWRSLEYDLPIIRSTNTGISTIVNIHGQELRRLGIGKTGNLDYSLSLSLYKETIYQKLGIFAFLILFALVFIFQNILLKYKHEN